MNPIELDLIIAKRLVRLSAWPIETAGERGWRAAQLTRQSNGQFGLSSDAHIVAEPTAVEAIALLTATILARVLPTETESCVFSLSTVAEPTPVRKGALPQVSAQASLTREERAADLKATIDAAIERLAQQLSDGHTDEFVQTLRFYSRFHKYSFGNLLLIQSQRPEATHVAGMRTWNEAGYTVKKGEKAIWIWRPLTKAEPDPETGDKTETVVGFIPVAVFDASQLNEIDEKPLPQVFQPLPDDLADLYQGVVQRIAAEGIAVEERLLPAGVQGASLGGAILIR